MKRLRARLEGMFTSEIYSYQQIRSMFLPLVLDQLSIYLIGILGVAMISGSGQEAVAAVSMVSTIAFIVTSIFTSMATGGAIIVAQAKGAGDLNRVREAAGQTVGLCTLIALAFGVIFLFASDWLVRMIFPSAEPVLLDYASHYLRVYSLSYIPYAIFNAVFNVFRCLGDARSSLFLTIVINGIYLICSFIFINILNMSVTGAALSYVVARLFGCVIALVWILKVHNPCCLRWRDFTRFSKTVLRSITRLGIPFATEQIFMQAGALLAQVYIASLSTVDIAAQAISNSIFSLYYSTAFALSALSTTLCGQAIGAKKPELARKYCLNLIKAGRVIVLASTAILLPLTPLLLRLYKPTPEAQALITRVLWIGAAGMPLIWCDAYVTPSALRSAGDAGYTTVFSLVALWVGRVGAGYLLTIVLGIGLPGVWLGMLLEWIIRAVVMRLRLRGRKWTPLLREEAQA